MEQSSQVKPTLFWFGLSVEFLEDVIDKLESHSVSESLLELHLSIWVTSSGKIIDSSTYWIASQFASLDTYIENIQLLLIKVLIVLTVEFLL